MNASDPFDLVRFVRFVRATAGHSTHEVFGTPDDLKFRSCATLFAQVSADPVFAQLLTQYFDGTGDPDTLRRLPPTPANPSVRR